LRISEESGDRRGQVGMMGEILGENHATSQWFPPLKHAWQRITGNTQISLVYRSWWTLFFVRYIMIFLIYSSLLGLLFFFLRARRVHRRPPWWPLARSTPWTERKMKPGRRHESIGVYQVPWLGHGFPETPTNGYWMGSPWITPKRLSTSHWSCDFSVLFWHGTGMFQPLPDFARQFAHKSLDIAQKIRDPQSEDAALCRRSEECS
jgi:hypothetical protein